VFIGLWASVGLIGYVLRDQLGTLRLIGGAIVVFLGLHVAGVINVSALYREVRLPVGPFSGRAMASALAAPLGNSMGSAAVALPAQRSRTPGYARSALLGVTFAAGWTPCIGPILGGILGLAAVGSSVLAGTALLGAYAMGLAVPFVLVAVGATSISDRLTWFREHERLVSLVTGGLLVAVGFLMVTNSFARLSAYVPFGL
ncbi:MAG TPA: cytochrome c biogenesis protein CcdA, partial [Candidatus Binatus sp.]|nr:cytochrome c biogenesis protein CcdA [Candidatus Binatus sp.]